MATSYGAGSGTAERRLERSVMRPASAKITSLADGRSFDSCSMHCLMRAATSGGHSSGTLRRQQGRYISVCRDSKGGTPVSVETARAV